MDNEEFKKDFLECYIKYVRVEHKRGITFIMTDIVEKLLEKYEVRKRVQ